MSRYTNENCNTTLRKLFNKDEETVIKLSINPNKNLKTHSKKSKTRETDMIELYHSINKLKSIMPSILTIMKKSINEEKTEDIIYQRFEHIEIENDLKNDIANIDEKIKLKKGEMEEKLNEISNLDEEINDTELNISFLANPEKFTLFNKQKENYLKEINENHEKVKVSKIQKKKPKFIKNNETKEDNDLNNTISSTSQYLKFTNQSEFELFLFKKKTDDEKKAKSMRLSLDPKYSKKKKLNEEIFEIEKEIDMLKKTKKLVKDQLYTHYLKLLKEGKDTRNEGLSWIIKEIYLLGKKVLMSYIPNFLDQGGIDFIFDLAKVSLKIKELNEKLNQSREILNNSGIKQVVNKFKTLRGKKISHFENSIYLTEKKKFNDYQAYAKSQDYTDLSNLKSINELVTIPPVIKLKDLEDLIERSGELINHEQMRDLFQYLEDLDRIDKMKEYLKERRKKEMDRIFNEYLRNDYKKRYNVEKNVVLSALIGEDNINAELTKQLKRAKMYMDDMNKIGMNKNKESIFFNPHALKQLNLKI